MRTRFLTIPSLLRWPSLAPSAALVIAATTCACGCTAAAPSVAGSTVGKASAYGSANASIELPPDEVFEPAMKLLLDRDDVDITQVDEATSRVSAVAGDRTVTLRAIDSGSGRCRLSILVGGGRDRAANQVFAEQLLTSICGRLPASCE